MCVFVCVCTFGIQALVCIESNAIILGAMAEKCREKRRCVCVCVYSLVGSFCFIYQPIRISLALYFI